jgi:hypothetical protein
MSATAGVRAPLQIPSLAALAIMAVFVEIGIQVGDAQLTWGFGFWLVLGVVCAAFLVRPVGLWTVVPAPPLVFLVVVLAKATWDGRLHWRGGTELATVVAPWLVHGFPHLAAAVVAGLVVTVVRLVVRPRGR